MNQSNSKTAEALEDEIEKVERRFANLTVYGYLKAEKDELLISIMDIFQEMMWQRLVGAVEPRQKSWRAFWKGIGSRRLSKQVSNNWVGSLVSQPNIFLLGNPNPIRLDGANKYVAVRTLPVHHLFYDTCW